MMDAASSRSGQSGGMSGLGQVDFMSLLLTQLQHQDPLNPLQPHEFAAQLANFSSVQQLSELNSGMANQQQSLDIVAALNKTAFSASLLGRTVLAEGNNVRITKGEKTTLPVDLGETGGKVTVTLYDKDGKKVGTADLGSHAGGRQDLTLPDDLPAGDFTVKVEVADDAGATHAATTYLSGPVDRVLFEGGQIVLSINGFHVPLDSLLEIAPSSSAEAAASQV